MTLIKRHTALSSAQCNHPVAYRIEAIHARPALVCENGRVIVLDAMFTPDRRNATLLEETSDPNMSPIHFHRISQPPTHRLRW